MTVMGHTSRNGKAVSPQPTQAEIEAAEATWNTNYDAKAYARTREAAYPSIGDQLDMLWHAIDGDATLKSNYADFPYCSEGCLKTPTLNNRNKKWL